MSVHTSPRSDMAPGLPYDRRRLEDIGYMTCMTLTLLGNYAQTGHFGGPLAYTPFNVAAHLAGPELGGLRYDYRRPKHPYGDKFMLAAGHCAPTCYALWMILGQALYRKHHATGDPRYHVAPDVAMLPVDALGFRRGAGALKTLLADQGLSDHPLFAQAKGRGIRALSGHIESTDLTNDVNGGPSGVGVATAAGKAAFWDIMGAPMGTPKVIALEGEFAMTEGHAQELKTQAIALQVGKRLRIFLSDNNAGIDDSLIGGVVSSKFTGYRLIDQWTSYGWNVLSLPDGHDYDQIVGALRTMEAWDPADRRPMIVIGTTTKGYWPGAVNGKIPGAGDQVVGYPSHPYGMKMNSEYFVALARTFEARYGVEFQGISQGPVTDPRERLIQFKTNIDVVMSVLERDGLGDWLADRLVEIGDSVPAEIPLRVDVKHDPFLDDRQPLIQDVIGRSVAFQGERRNDIGPRIRSSYTHHEAGDAVRRESPGLLDHHVVEPECARQPGEDRNLLRNRRCGQRTRANGSAPAGGRGLRGRRPARFNLCRYVCEIGPCAFRSGRVGLGGNGRRPAGRNRIRGDRVGRSARHRLGLRENHDGEKKHKQQTFHSAYAMSLTIMERWGRRLGRSFGLSLARPD